MPRQTYLIIYGGGGHQQEMERLLNYGVFIGSDHVDLVVFTDSCSPLNDTIARDKPERTIVFPEFRDKHSYLKTFFKLPWIIIKLVYFSFLVHFKYNIKGVISTGPGLAIIPLIIFKSFKIKTVVFESWAMFCRPSYTAKILYHFAGLFIVQHRSMLKVFPKAKYWGRL